MMQNYKENKAFYLIGIGGISMSAISKHLLKKGFSVSGSDEREGEETQKLRDLGIAVHIGHLAENVKGANAVIYNSAIKSDNPELAFARRMGIKIYSRMEFLSELAKDFKVSVGIAGCHGKTTATAMLANILYRSKLKFLSHIGGEDKILGNYFCNGDDVFLSEICEYKRNIDKFDADYACVLNIGFDHADCYNDIDDLQRTYFSYLDRAKTRIINADDARLSNYTGQRVCYAVNDANADFVASDIRQERGASHFCVNEGSRQTQIKLGVLGSHNVYNALNAFAAARRLGISEDVIKEGIEGFKGVERRFEKTGEINGAAVVCDYAHHPDEIAASLACAEKITAGRLFTVFQPHTYSRTKALMDCFVRVFKGRPRVSIYKTYAAREAFDDEGSAYRLFMEIGTAENYFDDTEKLICYLKSNAKAEDLILILGAGDLYDVLKTYL